MAKYFVISLIAAVVLAQLCGKSSCDNFVLVLDLTVEFNRPDENFSPRQQKKWWYFSPFFASSHNIYCCPRNQKANKKQMERGRRNTVKGYFIKKRFGVNSDGQEQGNQKETIIKNLPNWMMSLLDDSLPTRDM